MNLSKSGLALAAMLASFIGIVQPAHSQTASITGTVYNTDNTPCNRCTVTARQVSGIQGATVTYAGTAVSTRTESDGTWALTLLRSTQYQFAFSWPTGGLVTNPPETRTTCASASCSYPADLILVAGGTSTVTQGLDLTAKENGSTIQSGTTKLDGQDGITLAVDGGNTKEIDISVDATVVRTTGTQTVGGLKTFSAIPVLPAADPTTANQAARKAYVDALPRVVTLTPDSGTATADGSSDINLIGGDGITTSGASDSATIAVDGTVLRTTGGTLSGSLSMGGGVLVDGRDVSADGAKLDGIEANATADQTAAEVPVTDAGGHYTGSNVETVLAEIAPYLSDSRTPAAHASSHQNGGADEVSVAGLSGELADAQPVGVQSGGTLVGTRSAINFVQGSDLTLTVQDNPGEDRVDVTIAGPAPGSLPNSFGTINAPAGSDPVADSSTDTLNLTAGLGLTITGTAGTDTLDFAVDESALTLDHLGGSVTDAQVPAVLTLDGSTITDSSLTLVQENNPSPTAEGRVEWDSNDDQLVIGTGSGRVRFYSGAKVDEGDTLAGDVTATFGSSATTVEIASGAVGSTEIANGSITSADIADVDESLITFQTNDGSRHDHVAGDIASGTFADARISESSVTQHEAALSIAETQVPNGSTLVRVGDTFTGDVTGTLANGSTALSLAADSVQSSNIVNATITTSDLAGDAVTLGNMADNSVGTAEIVNGSVTASEIATGAVADDELADMPVLPGEYTNPTLYVDQDGRISAISSGTTSDSTTASNLGGGLANYSTTVGSDLRFNSFSSSDFDLASNLLAIDDSKWAKDSELHDAITLAGTPDYITLSGQEITLGQIDLAADVTGTLPAGSVGNGLTDAQVADTLTLGSSSTVTLAQSATPTPTAEGRIQWDTDDDVLAVGDGLGTVTFPNAAQLASTSGTLVGSIAVGAVAEAELADGGISSADIAAGAVDASAIATDAVGSAEIAADAVQSSEIAADAVGSSEIASDAVGPSELASTAVSPGSCTACNLTIDADGRITAQASGSGGSVAVKENNVLVGTADTIDLGAGFDVSETPAGEMNVILDYAEDPVDLSGSEVTGDLPAASIAEGSNAQYLVTASGAPTWVTISGDLAISAAGAATIQDGSVDLASDVSGSLPLGQIADDGATNKFLTSGGGSGDPTWVTLSTGNLPSGATLDTEWDTASEINAATSDADFSTLTTTQTFSGNTKTVTAKFDFGGGTLEVPNGINLPGSCVVGDTFMDSDAVSGKRLYLCEDTDTWVVQAASTIIVQEYDSTVDANTATIDFGPGFDVSSSPSGEANITLDYTERQIVLGTDVTGTLATGNLASGATLDTEWDTAAEINAKTTDDDLVTLAGTQTISGAKTLTGSLDAGGGILELPNTTSCVAGDCDSDAERGRVCIDTDATSGRQLYICEGTTSGWVLQGTSSNTVTTQEGDVTVTGSAATIDFGAGFDLTDSPSGETNVTLDYTENKVGPTGVDALDAAGDEECLTYETTGGQFEWQPCGGGGGGSANVKEAGSVVTTAATDIDFGAGFDITDSPTGEANIVLDLTEKQVNLATEVTGTLPAASVGTGLTDAQVDNDISIAGGSIGSSDITLEASASPSQTDEARIVWDSDDDRITVGTGASTAVFYNGTDLGNASGTIVSSIASGAVGPDELVSTAVTPGSCTACSLTIDADGRVTAQASGSGASIIVQEGDSTVDATASTIDFGAGFDVTSSPSGEANITLDLTEKQVNLGSEVTGNLPVASLVAGSSAQILMNSGVPTPTWTTVSGDATISNTGVVALANDSVAAAEIAADAVGSSEIASGAVGASEIAADVVDGTQLADTITVDGSTLGVSLSGTKVLAVYTTDASQSADVLLSLTNSDTGANDTLTTGMRIASDDPGAAIAIAIDVSDAAIGTALDVGTNNIQVTDILSKTISPSELARLDGLTSAIVTADSNTVLTNKTLDAAATGNVIKMTSQIRMDCSTPGVSGAQYTPDTTGATSVTSNGWAFDPDADEQIICTARLPSYFDASSTVSVIVDGWFPKSAATCSGASESAAFNAAIKSVAPNSAVTGAWGATTADQTVTTTCTATLHSQTDTLREITFTPTESAAAGDTIFVSLIRNADDAADTYDYDYFMLNNVILQYGISQ